MEYYKPGIGIVSGLQMLKWDTINMHLQNYKVDSKDINVFINFESVIRNLSNQKLLGELVNFHKQKLVIELESSILNLVAHYRMYFKYKGYNPKVYLYHTSLSSETQQMRVYNKFYRSYYHNRYMQNPQFKMMGEILNDIIIPEVKLILYYVQGCYFVEADTFDGSLIPLIISENIPGGNVIVSSDIFDTLYLFNTNFLTLYLKRRFSHFQLISDRESAVQSIVKWESVFDLTIFNSELYYKLLLSIKGSKIRNIRSAKGFGYGKFLKIIKDGMDESIILKDFESIDSVIELFPEKYRDDIKESFKCSTLDIQYSLLSDTDKENIIAQMIDRSDIASVESLNNKRFLDFPINLQSLIG